MVTKLKTDATYRLVDKDGWFATHPSIEKLFISHFNQDGEITIEEVYENGHGWRKGEFVIDAEKDLKFFEEVVTSPEKVEEVVTELKANTTYRLIDKAGWFARESMNRIFFTLHFNHNNEITLEEVDESGTHGWYGGDIVIDAEFELRFFEEVVTSPEKVEEVVTETVPETVPRPAIFIQGKEWLIVGEHPTQKDKIICVKVSDNRIDCFDSSFVEEKLKPKSWQEHVCEDFDVKLCKNGDFCFQHTLTEHRVIEMAKRIIELTEGEIK